MDVTGFAHHHADINGLRQHWVTCGEGPAVLFAHGFPDMWRLWRRQMAAVADAGFRAIAPDLRGFGESEGPADPERYTVVDVIGDLVSILDRMGVEQAVIVGHDWGANVSWAAPVLRPDRFIAVASLAVPYTRRPPKSVPQQFRDMGREDFYMCHFCRPGVGEAELDEDPERFLRRLFYTLSGALPAGVEPNMFVGASGRFTDSLIEPPAPLDWFDADEMEIYVAHFRRRGFSSALSAYRSLTRSWELMAAWGDRIVEVPALFIYGSEEIVVRFPGRAEEIARFTTTVPRGMPPVRIEAAGHWVQLEAPDKVNRALLAFLDAIGWASGHIGRREE